MDPEVKVQVEREVERLKDLLADADELLSGSLNTLLAHVEEQERLLNDVGDARERAQRVSEGVGRSLGDSARGFQVVVDSLPRLAAATQPMLDDMRVMNGLLRELDGLAHTTLLNALNASAAAERAGPAGAAFGVVAQEVAALPASANEIGHAVRTAISQTTLRLEQVSADLEQGAQVVSRAVADATRRARDVADEIQGHGQVASSSLVSSATARKRAEAAVQRGKVALSRFDAGRVPIAQLKRLLNDA